MGAIFQRARKRERSFHSRSLRGMGKRCDQRQEDRSGAHGLKRSNRNGFEHRRCLLPAAMGTPCMAKSACLDTVIPSSLSD